MIGDGMGGSGNRKTIIEEGGQMCMRGITKLEKRRQR